MGENKIRVLVIEPGKFPVEKEITPALETYQKIVGGYIDCVYPFSDSVGLVCNDEGKLIGLPLNRALYDESGRMYDAIAGTFIIVGLSEDSFTSLTKEQARKFNKKFFNPEVFFKFGSAIMMRRSAKEFDPEKVDL